jgi:hypothetical protein
MSDSITPSPSPSETSSTAAAQSPVEADVKQEVAALRALVLKLQSLLLALTIIAGMFIAVNFWRARNELAGVRTVVAQARSTDPAVQQFINQLVDYARRNPEFAQILGRYPIQVAAQTNTPAAAGAPKPAPTSPAPAAQPRR